HNIYGGLYSAIAEVKAKTDIATPVYPIGINDTFGESGKAKDVLQKYGLTAENVVKVVKG
ncbi:MAG: transketolase family protein, partial [Erysipelotrichaceae bacterium]|nr:transketolase family protein [Erysipelotrichaceae bacterium]